MNINLPFRKLSFKRKILIPIFIVLLAGLVCFAVYININLKASHENNRILTLDKKHKIVENAIISMRGELIKAGDVVKNTFDLLSDLIEGRKNTKEEIIEKIGMAISRGGGGIDVYFYNEDSEEMISYGDEIDVDYAKVIINHSRFVDNYFDEYVLCDNECVLFLTKKVVLDGQSNYFAILAFRIFRFVDIISESTGSNIVLLKNANKNEPKGSLSLGDYEVEYATNLFDILPIVNKLELRDDIGFHFIEHEGEYWEYGFIPTVYNKFSLLYLENVTESTNLLYKGQRNSIILLTGIYAFLFFLLYFLLKVPLARLKLIGGSIPLLGSGQFRNLRDRLGLPKEDVDELDLIHKTAYDVSITLQDLENKQKKTALKLTEALNNKSEQYELLKQLIDHSQIIIILYDSKHQIYMINEFSSKYIICSLEEAVGKKIFDIFGADNHDSLLKMLNVLPKESDSVEHKMHYFNEPYWINWIHCDAPGDMYLSIGVDITDRKLAEQSMKRLAEKDSLTGLYNRGTFTEKLIIQLEKNRELDNEELNLGLFYIDLDKFKQINDRLGHHKGDDYLKAVSSIIVKECQGKGCTGRLGGDEFSVFFQDISEESAYEIASSIVDKANKVQQADFDIGIHASLSIGMVFSPMHSGEAGELMSMADMAMYHAKNSPSQNICTYSKTMWHKPLTKFDKRRFLNNLIAHNEIIIYSQPVYKKGTDKVFYLECLSRQKSSLKLPIFKYADECGLAGELDLYICEQAISSFVRYYNQSDAYKGPRLGLNLSAQSLMIPSFYDEIARIVEKHQILYEQLIFEITETSEILNLGQAVQFINALRSKGALVALDDFGDGFASLRYLRNLPFDIVKIDGQFVMDIDKNLKDQIIVNSLITAAKQFNLEIVIECIETASVDNYFEDSDVDYVQGFYYTKPVPIKEALQQLSNDDVHGTAGRKNGTRDS